MKLVKRVQSSNLNFIQTEVNVDTVYVRFNEEKWFVESEDGMPVHVGWIYDEEQYEIREYIEKISSDNSILSELMMETVNESYQIQLTNEQHLMEIYNIIGGM